MASPGTQRERRRTPKIPRYRIFGITLNQRELIIVAGCVVFLCIAAIGIIVSGGSKSGEDSSGEPPSNVGGDDTQQPAAFALSQASVTVEAGSQVTLSTSGEKGDVVWTSSDEAVATVEGGVVTGVSEGSAVITAESEGETVVCAVTVPGGPKVNVSELYLNRTDFTIRPGDPKTVQMTVKYKETRKVYEGEVTWASADTRVVTVSETGLVERVGRGDTKVTATIDGQTLECIARVR